MEHQKSVAVLPFENLSSDPENEYFSDGMTDELINALSRVEGLKVTARTSSYAFKGLKEDVRIIGNKLGVDTVLEGSIRKAGTRVRIAAQLIRTDFGFHIWSESFDREMADIFDLQDEISLLIVDRIREHFGHLELEDHLVTTKTTNAEAYQSLLKGAHHFKRKDLEDIRKALSFFEESILADPGYAEAYAYIGECYLHYAGFNMISASEGHAKAREAAEKALAINSQEARAHKVMAYIYLFYDWNWDAAIDSYNKAIASGLTAENEFITYYYIFIQKNYNRAIEIAKQNAAKDPLHVITHWQLGLCYYFSARFEDALNAFEQSLELDDSFGESWRWKGLVLGHLGRFNEAFKAIDRALEITQGEGLAQLDKLAVQVMNNEREIVIEALEQNEYLDPCDPAQIYSLLNMPEKAVEYLRKGYEVKSVMMVTLKYFWIWDNIREHEGFQELFQKMNFHEQKSHRTDAETSFLKEENTIKLTEAEILSAKSMLNEILQDENVVTNTELSLRSLASMINLHPNRLSWLLNQHYGKNFNEFINQYRLEVFKAKAADPANKHLTLLGLAYESGFNSKSVFNNFFKKSTGQTPKEWLKSNT